MSVCSAKHLATLLSGRKDEGEAGLLEFCKSLLAPPCNPIVDEVEAGRAGKDLAALR